MAMAGQRHRMNRAMNYARANVGEDLDLHRLADIACLSKYHFLRAFRDHFHETPIQFLQRIRLEHAASQLVYYPEARITDVALDSGFRSTEYFSRAFRSRFGVAPRSFKASNRWCFDTFRRANPLKHEVYIPPARLRQSDIKTFRVRTEYRPAQRIAYIRHLGPFGDVGDSITRTFDALQRWARQRGLPLRDASYIGVCSGNVNITPAHLCLYDAGLFVRDDIGEDETVSVRVIPEGWYATLHVQCPPEALNSRWQWLTATWLPASGWRMAFRPCYELFRLEEGQRVRSEFGARLCLAVTR